MVLSFRAYLPVRPCQGSRFNPHNLLGLLLKSTCSDFSKSQHPREVQAKQESRTFHSAEDSGLAKFSAARRLEAVPVHSIIA